MQPERALVHSCQKASLATPDRIRFTAPADRVWVCTTDAAGSQLPFQAPICTWYGCGRKILPEPCLHFTSHCMRAGTVDTPL
jgi:predicted nucleic acid binding AN1-type Zn finger protein